MGKYMKKAKALIGEVSLLGESPDHTPFIGVCTRARTLALQRLQSPSASPSPASPSYLQLRSRRLQKTKPASPKRSPKSIRKARPCSRSVPKEAPENDRVEVSFGENALDCEARSRNARETTPCSPIKDSETVVTPGSTTRPTSSTAVDRRTQSSVPRYIPTTDEMEEFFSSAEHLQQRSFAEKYRYNYDPVKDCPLPGRYEWVQLDSQAAHN